MKKLIISACLLFIGTCSIAQFEWLGNGQEIDKYVLTQENGHILLHDGYFTAMDGFGNKQHEFPDIGAIDTVTMREIFELLDSSYVFYYDEVFPSAMIGLSFGTRANNTWSSFEDIALATNRLLDSF